MMKEDISNNKKLIFIEINELSFENINFMDN